MKSRLSVFILSLSAVQLIAPSLRADVSTDIPQKLSCREKYIAEIMRRGGKQTGAYSSGAASLLLFGWTTIIPGAIIGLASPSGGLEKGLAAIDGVNGQENPFKTKEETDKVLLSLVEDVREEGFEHVSGDRVKSIIKKGYDTGSFCYMKDGDTHLKKDSDIRDYVVDRLKLERMYGIQADGGILNPQSMSEAKEKTGEVAPEKGVVPGSVSTKKAT